jgi:adenine-specific DNA-methyltransferase
MPTTAVPPELLQRDAVVRTRLANQTETLVETLAPKLGPPWFAGEGFILYQKDCLASLSALQSTEVRFNLTVTSPPYNIGKEYEQNQQVDEYIEWCSKWLRAIYDVTTENGALWLNLGYFEVQDLGRCVPIPYLLWNRSPFYLLQEIVWHYGAGVATKTRFSPRNEKWLFYIKNPEEYVFNLDDVRDPNVKYPDQKKNGKLKCNPLGKNPSDVWILPKVTTGANRSSKERTGHPAQFPLQVVDRIIKTSSNPGDVVLDPFAGSGSLGIAAVGNGRVFVGFEISEDYCGMARARFEQFVAL